MRMAFGYSRRNAICIFYSATNTCRKDHGIQNLQFNREPFTQVGIGHSEINIDIRLKQN